jgi:thiol-disulfide isomerase/thioredoxin
MSSATIIFIAFSATSRGSVGAADATGGRASLLASSAIIMRIDVIERPPVGGCVTIYTIVAMGERPMKKIFAAGVVLTMLICLDFAPAAAADAKRPALPIGSVPEDQLGKDLEGNQVRISDYQGKVVIVSFWASWCGPCKKELPVLAGIVKRVGPDHLKVIAINYQDEQKPFKYVVNVLKDFPITILRDQNSKTAKKFDVQGIPRMIIIGRDGKVAADHTGYGESMIPELVEQLNALLAQKTET